VNDGIAELARVNLTAPAVLAFALGVIASRLKSDLRFPPAVTSLLSTYLLFAIGLKGGVALAESSIQEVFRPTIATLVIAVTTPVIVFAVLRRWGRFGPVDAAALAAHYGSVSAVTFTAAVAFVAAAGYASEGFMPALVAILEIPGIVVALALAHRATGSTSLGEGLREVITGKSVVLLVGGLGVGMLAGPGGVDSVRPFFFDLFPGLLVLFLLDLGVLAGDHLAAARKAGRFLVGFALGAPLVMGAVGVGFGTVAGLSVGGAAVLGAMAASASYIAAPAAVRIALPEANPGLYLTAALALTFPLNLIVGIPLYTELSKLLQG
jgi:uncharacterized protein